jgi:hypothetical protein
LLDKKVSIIIHRNFSKIKYIMLLIMPVGNPPNPPLLKGGKKNITLCYPLYLKGVASAASRGISRSEHEIMAANFNKRNIQTTASPLFHNPDLCFRTRSRYMGIIHFRSLHRQYPVFSGKFSSDEISENSFIIHIVRENYNLVVI